MLNPDLQDDEFVAAYPRHRIADAQHASEPVGNELEQCVACGMPQIIIDRLEVVKIDEQHGNFFTAPNGLGEDLPEAIQEEGAIGQVSKRVMKGKKTKEYWDDVLSFTFDCGVQ